MLANNLNQITAWGGKGKDIVTLIKSSINAKV